MSIRLIGISGMLLPPVAAANPSPVATGGPAFSSLRPHALGVILWVRPFVVAGLALGTAVMSTGQVAHAQFPEPVLVREAPSDESWRIVVEPVADLGDREGPGAVNEAAHIWEDARGRFIVSAAFNHGVVQVFDGSGRFLQSFGREGQGPGEYQRPRVLFEHADTLFIFDTPRRRITRLNHEFEVLNTSIFPLFAGSVIRLSDGSMLASTVDDFDPYSFGLPLHLLSPDGTRRVQAFGVEAQTVRMGELLSRRRVIAPSRSGGFWAGHQQRYRIEHWGEQVTMTDAIEREVSWFEPYIQATGPAREVPPSPILRAIQEDDAGFLWVLVLVAAEDWTPLPPASEEAGMTRTSSAQRNRLHDTIIEAIDPVHGVVLATLRVPESLGRFFVGPGLVYSYAEDEAGHPWYRISRLRLIPDPKGGDR